MTDQKLARAYNNAMEDIVRLGDALRELVEACAYVSPICGAVATKTSVKDIRNAGRFIKAVERAKAALAPAHTKGE